MAMGVRFRWFFIFFVVRQMIYAFACLLKKGVFENPLFFRGAGARGGSITGDLGFARRNTITRWRKCCSSFWWPTWTISSRAKASEGEMLSETRQKDRKEEVKWSEGTQYLKKCQAPPPPPLACESVDNSYKLKRKTDTYKKIVC
jgi:hypothetical protein